MLGVYDPKTGKSAVYDDRTKQWTRYNENGEVEQEESQSDDE